MKKFLLGGWGTVIAGIFVALFTLYIKEGSIVITMNISAGLSKS